MADKTERMQLVLSPADKAAIDQWRRDSGGLAEP
jgi:hypothetical protein